MAPVEESTRYISQVTMNHVDEYSLQHIFSYLPPIDKLTLETVCTKWKEVSKRAWVGIKNITLIRNEMVVNNCNGTISNFDEIMSIIKRCKSHIRHLELFTYTEESNTLAEKIVVHCKALQSVKLCGVTRQVVVNLSKKNKDLREFYLRDMSESCDETLSKIFCKNQKLIVVELVAVKTRCYGNYLRDLPIANLQSFRACLSNISAENFIWIFSHARSLSQLAFEDCKIDEKCIKAIRNISNLRELQVGVFLPYVKNFQHLYYLRNLQKIDVSSCPIVTDEFLHNLSYYCVDLIDVNISGCEVTDVGVHKVAELPKLERLHLNLLAITDNAFRPMPTLKELECYFCKNLSNRYFINIVKSCNKLEVLNVSCCQKVNNRLVDSAVVNTRNRKNNTVLKLFVGNSRVRHNRIKQASPRLQVIFDVRFVLGKEYASVQTLTSNC